MKRISVIFILFLTIAGCNPYNMENTFLQQSEISLTWKGEVQVSYDPADCQIGFNDKTCEYRVYDDRLSQWFTIRCSENPEEEGQVIAGDVSWTGGTGTKSFQGLPFEVKQISSDGLIKLWNEDKDIGIIIKDIQ